MRVLLATILLLNLSLSLSARQKVFDFNPRCQQAYDAIMQLRLNVGLQLLNEEKKDNPDNLIPYYLDNYADFFQLFFNEDPNFYSQRKKMRAERLELMAEGPGESPYYLYTQAAIKFQWALVKVKFGERWDAVWEIRRAYTAFRDNQKKYPSFVPNNMMVGALQTVFGTIPEGYKWITNILGLRGSIKQGMQNVQLAVDSNSPYAQLFREESYFYYCYLKLFIENKPEQVWQLINEKKLDTKNNYLYALMVAQLSMNNQKSQQGITALTERNRSAEYVDIAWENYLLGQLKLNRLDDDATAYLERFLARFKGRFFVKEALQKLSWGYYIKGNLDMANKYRAQILTRGGTDTDADKQALKEAKAGTWPNPLLLRVRLLSDGGFYSEALKLLQGKKAGDFSTSSDRLEYAYRLGRIYDEMNYDQNAISMYEVTARLGANRTEYFAARSCLQLGYIYEKRGDKANAQVWFQKCLDMEGHDYKNSLDQRAKAGILRLSGN
ncbi:hypothetical protein MKQ68_00525 [Chitinophaga horti]|uniref:Tetratricopeptide repeat protein n=1 Tax=Chitinophaga horti TaxID=2920382 RepID=A0ABY6J1S4_9BACT|nr:hypothetical protein [Chitinophaga horti]UYQ93585.1 hypothetical protein MKQ68_00525 [Chitinophaga horti]